MRIPYRASLALIALLAACESSDPVAPQVDVDAALSQATLGAAAYGDFGVASSIPAPGMRASDCTFCVHGPQPNER